MDQPCSRCGRVTPQAREACDRWDCECFGSLTVIEPITRDQVLAALARHIGEPRGVHVRELVGEIQPDQRGSTLAERRVRELVLELRLEGHHICAHPSSGYYMAESAEELDRTCVFLYERAIASLQQIAAMRRISLPDLRGQLRLPT
jgi:hypothetical protein